MWSLRFTARFTSQLKMILEALSLAVLSFFFKIFGNDMMKYSEICRLNAKIFIGTVGHGEKFIVSHTLQIGKVMCACGFYFLLRLFSIPDFVDRDDNCGVRESL